tara:strand:+ start:1399 stop:2232 length:834 start_codon:yes stop_codon:yes gene_type:complete
MRQPPDLLAWALGNDTYSKDGADFTTTEILQPPQLTFLKQSNEPKKMPVYKSFMSLLGTGVHAALEGSAPDSAIVERRFYKTYNIDGVDYKLGGKPDYIDDKLLDDYKVVMVSGAPKDGLPKHDHYWQGQFNSFLAIHEGVEIDTACVEYIFRDWNYGMSMRQANYPKRPNLPVPFLVLPLEQIEAKIIERLTLHVRASLGHNVPCTDEERWKKPNLWALQKPAGKRARKLCTSEAEAITNKKPGEEIQFRPGTTIRCNDWCEFSHVCPQHNTLHLT